MAASAVRTQKGDPVEKQNVNIAELKVETKFGDSAFGREKVALNNGIELMLKARKEPSWFNRIDLYEKAIEQFGAAWDKASPKYEASGEAALVLKNSAHLEKEAYSELAKVFRGMSEEEKLDFVNELNHGNSLGGIYGKDAPKIPSSSPTRRTFEDELKFEAECIKFVDRLAGICETRARKEEQP